MKIVLLRPNWNTRWAITAPLGLMYVVAAAKKAGHYSEIIDAWLYNLSPVEAAYKATLCSDIIGVQVFSDTVQWTKEFIAEARKHSKAKFIIGGAYATVVGEKARIETGADVCIQGEADNSFDFMLAKIQSGDTAILMPWTDLDILPIPDYACIRLHEYWPSLHSVSCPTKGKRIATIQRTRGCKFACTFCAAGATMGHKVRIRDTANVIEEIEYLKHQFFVNEIWFQDDNAIVDYTKGMELFEALAPLKVHIRLPNGIRWENVDYPMAIAMKKAGVYFTGIGIESGNSRVLKRIKKGINLEGLNSAISILNNVGIITIGFFILGLPTETRDEIKDTVRFALKSRLRHAQFGIFIPYPGAQDYNEQSLLPNDDLVKIQRNTTLRFYLRPRIIWGMIKNFQFSQIKAITGHKWVRSWFIKGESDE